VTSSCQQFLTSLLLWLLQQLGKAGVVSDAAQPSARAVLEWKIKSVKAMLQVFYLTGNVSGFACVLPTAAFLGW